MLIFALLFVAFGNVSAQDADSVQVAKKPTKSVVYLFGVGAAFGDSLLFVTEVHEFPGVELEKKTRFLKGRSEYMAQLKLYLEDVLGLPHRTCAIYFSDSKKSIFKQYAKLMKRYKGRPDISLHHLGRNAFNFTPLYY